MELTLKGSENDSTTALSSQLPVALMLESIPKSKRVLKIQFNIAEPTTQPMHKAPTDAITPNDIYERNPFSIR